MSTSLLAERLPISKKDMAGLPPAAANMGQPCMYSDPSVYVKTEYDQGKVHLIRSKMGNFRIFGEIFR